ncbi:MAG TPA: type IV pilin protein [Gammaproteobacteria bacterium]|nr:type IV pilin protein [Gammaproteobacteria bacterium]
MLSVTQKGFTLLELITTFAIVGILITLSYPSYMHYILKTRRTHAQIALVDLAAGLERYRSSHQTYIGATLNNLEVNAYTENNYYQIQLNNATDSTYLLQATPLGSQTEDKTCGTLSLDESGQKKFSGNGQQSACW